MNICDHSHFPIALIRALPNWLFRVDRPALRAVLKPENMSSWKQRTSDTNTSASFVCLRFKYAFFYRRLPLFEWLFGSLFSLVSIAVWIISTYCKTLELIYFVFETFYLLSFFCFWVLQRSRALWFFFFSLCQYNLVIARCMYYIFKINITLNMFFNNNKNNRLFEVSGWTPRRKMLIHFVQQSWRISRNIRTTLEIMKYSLCRFILGSEQCYWFTCVLFWLF